MNDNLDLSILKTLLSSKKAALEFSHDCDPKLFHSDYWRFAKAVLDYVKVYKSCATKRTLLEQVRKNEALSKHLGEVFDKVSAVEYDEKEYAFDLERLKNRYSEKLIVDLQKNLSGSEGRVDVKKGISEIQGALVNIKSISGGKVYKEGSLRDYAKDFKSIYEAKLKNPEHGRGIKTGYTFLDEAINGVKGSEMMLVAGTTGAGKSMLLANLGVQMWQGGNDINTTDNFRKGANILLFSLEMEFFDYTERILARTAMVKQRHLRDATLLEDEKVRVARAFKFINSFDYQFKIVDTPKLTTDGLELALNNEIETTGIKPDILIVDYLNLIKPNDNKELQDWRQQGQIAENLHQIARQFDIAVLSAIQLNPKGNESKDGGSEFGIKSLRRSTEIADNCDFLLAIQTRKQERNYPDLAIDLLKNRRGPLMSGKLSKHFECCAILDQKIEDNGSGDINDISGLVG